MSRATDLEGRLDRALRAADAATEAPHDYIETYTGRRFRPLAPVVADIVIMDIAHALSNQCRFSGHTSRHYSVAEHCVRVSWLLRRWGCGREVQLWGLLHDASEAYLVDLPTPLKNSPELGPAYRAAEYSVMAAVVERFGLLPCEPPAVRHADAVMLATEVRDLMPGRAEHWAKLTESPDPEYLTPSADAKGAFLRRFFALENPTGPEATNG